MSTLQQTNPTASNIAGWLVICLCYLVGFYHTAIGFREAKILDSDYGSYIISIAVTVILLVAYKEIVKGKYIVVLTYILFASVSFAGNFNSIYPNFMEDSLFRRELEKHRDSLTVLNTNIKTSFSDSDFEAKVQRINSLSLELQNQIKNYGFLSRSEIALKAVENAFEESFGRREDRFPRLKTSTNKESWDNIASQYKEMIESRLNEKRARIIPALYQDIVQKSEDITKQQTDKVSALIEHNNKITFDVARPIVFSPKIDIIYN